MASPTMIFVLRLCVLALVFGAIVWGTFRLMSSAQETAAVRRQVRSVGSFDTGRRERGASEAWGRLVALVERGGLSLADSNPDALRAKMIAAGFESPDAPRFYLLARLLLVIVLPVASIGVLLLSGIDVSVFRLYMTGLLAAAAALLGPTWYLRVRTAERFTAITNGFPNCLDLMLVCVEAGLGMDAALDRVGREMAEAEPHVSQMLVRTTLHLRAGASREEALRRMGDLAGVDEVRAFCTLLIQSDRLGTSIAATLRIFAADMRERRRMRAEEKAHRLPVLISVPLIACMLPTMLGVLMLPAAIRVVRDLLPAMMGK